MSIGGLIMNILGFRHIARPHPLPHNPESEVLGGRIRQAGARADATARWLTRAAADQTDRTAEAQTLISRERRRLSAVETAQQALEIVDGRSDDDSPS